MNKREIINEDVKEIAKEISDISHKLEGQTILLRQYQIR